MREYLINLKILQLLSIEVIFFTLEGGDTVEIMAGGFISKTVMYVRNGERQEIV